MTTTVRLGCFETEMPALSLQGIFAVIRPLAIDYLARQDLNHGGIHKQPGSDYLHYSFFFKLVSCRNCKISGFGHEIKKWK